MSVLFNTNVTIIHKRNIVQFAFQPSQVPSLPFTSIAGPAPVIKRPYDGLSNPYPYGCSKLCNHPIDAEIKKEYKDILKKAKESWVRRKSFLTLERLYKPNRPIKS